MGKGGERRRRVVLREHVATTKGMVLTIYLFSPAGVGNLCLSSACSLPCSNPQTKKSGQCSLFPFFLIFSLSFLPSLFCFSFSQLSVWFVHCYAQLALMKCIMAYIFIIRFNMFSLNLKKLLVV